MIQIINHDNVCKKQTCYVEFTDVLLSPMPLLKSEPTDFIG